MENLKIVRDKRKYSNGWHLMLGKINAFYIGWDSMIPRESKNNWKLICNLPGYTGKNFGHFKEANDAKDAAEDVFIKWLKAAGLELKVKRIKS